MVLLWWCMILLCLSTFWRVIIINGFWILSKALFAFIEMVVGFFCFLFFFLVFQFVNLVHHIYWFSLLKNSCIHGTKPAWSFLYVVGFCLLGFCWGLFIFVHQWNWPLIFWFFYIIFVWFVIMVIMASEWVQEFFFLCNFLCLSSIGVASESESCSVASDSLWPHGLYSLWNSPGQNTAVGSLSLFQGIFPTQGSNPGLLHCRWILYQLSHRGSPRILECVAYPFSHGSSWPRSWTWAYLHCRQIDYQLSYQGSSSLNF